MPYLATRASHGGGLTYERRIRARTLHRIEAAIADLRNTLCGQSRAQLRAVAVGQGVIHDRSGQAACSIKMSA